MIHSKLMVATSDSADGSASKNAGSNAVQVMAGLADRNANLFRRLGIALGDPAAWLKLPDGKNIGIVRDLEMDRTRAAGRLDRVHCPADFPPASGSASGDRETASAQSVARFLQLQSIDQVVVDRAFPFIYAWHLADAGIAVAYDDDLGVIDRRVKTDEEIDWLRKAQSVTEAVMRQMCEMIATADVGSEGRLMFGGEPLTSERVRTMAGEAFMKRNYTMSHGAIVATLPDSADCHHRGDGNLYTGHPVIVDLFPRDESTRYNGDCTRTVVNGTPSETVQKMHAAVVASKEAAEAVLFPGRTGEEVQLAVEKVLVGHGYPISRGELTDGPSIQHGTGHGIGLEVHEPILLDHGGGEMLAGEVFTVEPGLYGRQDGGVRVEDMLVVTADGPVNLNQLPMGLDWNPN
ncbi:MAG TPA: X-pro aminopeptidase PepQ2 [Rhodopirellula baltica]|uniref:Probable X-pro aminopeptidase homolog PepQ2 n=1 Tax=Rhodopirellula baltica (strain DSM 10527 / NCIMB 13988 / SH1) TaxID=243090 RepID=Q7UES6_RHOBA|nr:M24 family metallopeptidase [Rhodopirellula baltica]CAD78958.1 probable X-pro aminopeptidase homolog PepQ2 [Rhodopirellula baltica SH 1]HBE64439.1 X-pro aminopeptidase PepQ2 [Rhodopirellula baltica]